MSDERDGGPVEILLVEDNPGDARYIREILREATELSERTFDRGRESLDGAVDGSADEPPELVHETRLEDGIERLEDDPDVVLLDLNLPDSAGLDTLTTLLEHADGVPVIVLTGLRDREVGMEALQRGAEEYLVKDEINADLLVRSIYHAIVRKAHERELEQQRERLAALNQLNGIVQEIMDAIIEQPTREEIEWTVCDALASSDSYEFAWIGDVDSTTDTVQLRTEAGVENYLAGTTISVDPDDPRSQGPTGQAVITREIQIAQDVLAEDDYEPWQEHAAEHEYRSSAAIPIVHEGTLYGVLNVYASRPGAFAEEERAVIGQLGEIVGHAIASVERKRALMSDDVVEVDFRIENAFVDLDVPVATEERITLDQVVPVGGDRYLVYGTADEADLSVIEALVDRLSYWESVTVVEEELGEVSFELHLSDPPVFTTVASHGGYLEEARLEDGDYHLRVQFPHSVDVSRIIDALQSTYPTTEMVAQRQVSRPDEGRSRVVSAFEERLTDRQRTVLETAYFRGYFDWPRGSSGEEIAESLSIAPATFSQHLRAAEKRIIGAVLEGRRDD